MRSFQSHQLIAWSIFMVLGGGYLCVGLISPVWFIRLTYEDLYTEWGQLLFFVVVFLLAATLAARGKAYRLFFSCLALAALYTVMEEISWGQRLLDVETPDFFWENNIQEEMNIHNLFTGPEDTLLKDSIEFVLALALVGFGLVYPALLRYGAGLAVWIERIGIPASPLYLSPYFVAGAGMELGLLNFNEAEVAELLIGAALAFMCAHYLLLGPPDKVRQIQVRDDLLSRRLSLCMVSVTLGVGVLAIGMTRYLYSIPAWEARLESRIINGMEKYGRRYEYKEQWVQAADLYNQAYVLRPRPALLRQLVQAYQVAGNDEAFQLYYRELLEQTIPPGSYKSADVKTQLSLMESYRRAGLTEKADYHLQFAYRVARRWVQKEPGDAEHVYLLGLTEQYRGDNLAAAENFGQATELDPENEKYAQAWRAALRNVK